MQRALIASIFVFVFSPVFCFGNFTEQSLYKIGLERFQSKDYAAAADYLGQAADMNRQNVWARYFYVFSIASLGKRHEATKWLPSLASIANTPEYKKLTALLNINKPAKKNKAVTIEAKKTKNLDKPRTVPKKKAAKSKDDILDLVQALIDSDRTKEAFNLLEVYLKSNSSNGRAWQLLGFAHFNHKDYQKTIDSLKKAFARGVSDFDSFFIAAQASLNMQNSEEALNWYEKAGLIKPEDAFTRLAIADLYCSKSDYKKASKIYEEVLKRDKNLVDAEVGLTRIALERGFIEEALERINSTLSKHQDNAKARFLKANILLKQREYAHALEEAELAYSNNPSNIEYKVFCSLVKIRNFMIKEAKEELNAVLQEYPENVYALSTLGEAYLTEGKNQEGKEALKKAEAVKKIANTSQLLALIEFYDGNHVEAEKHYKEYCKRSGNTPESLLEYAEFTEARPNAGKSIKAYQTIIDRFSGTPFADKASVAIEKLRQKK